MNNDSCFDFPFGGNHSPDGGLLLSRTDDGARVGDCVERLRADRRVAELVIDHFSPGECASKTSAGRLSEALLHQFGTRESRASWRPLDIDDTFCAAHGREQVAFWTRIMTSAASRRCTFPM